jgi:DNA (cytosine-5)-methyltransferase 1
LRALDLFCGACGGWSLGLHRAGFQTVAACEIDPWRRAVFLHNNPGVVMYDDVRTLTAERLRRDLGFLPDIIVGSPPCQDASAANTKGKGVDGERTGLFFEAIRLVRECRPFACAFENVANIRTRGADRLLDALETIGYACEPFVVGADDVSDGLHERKRAWFVAFDTESLGCDGWRPRGRWTQGNAEPSIEAGSLDAAILGRRTGAARRSDRRIAGPADGAWPASGPAAGSAGWQERHGAEPDEQEIPESLRALAADWPDWNDGLGSHLRVGDGLSIKLARECISAYGDAVLPQITEAIGRAILRTEAALAAVCEAAE